MMSVEVKTIPQDIVQKIARELLKVLIRRRTLVFTVSDLRDMLPEGVDVYDVVDFLDEKLRLVKLAIVSDKADEPSYMIVPAKLAEDEKIIDALFKLIIESEEAEKFILKLTAKFLSSCGLGAYEKDETGIALPFVKIAEAWGIEFEKDYSLFSNGTYTGIVELCIDDVCIYERVYYCNYICNAHGIFKCCEYLFELPEEYREKKES